MSPASRRSRCGGTERSSSRRPVASQRRRWDPVPLPHVGVEGLLTYQYYVDTDCMDKIAADVPKPGDWQSVFEFCTRRTPLAEPFIDLAGVTFSSHYAGNNGNHRVAALVRAGHTEVPAVVQQVMGSIHQMGVAVEGNFNENTLLNTQRAPLATDYLNPAATTDLKLRALNSILRVGFQAQGFCAPR